MKSNKAFETIVHGIFLVLGLVTVACVLLITLYLVVAGIPAIARIGLWDFLFGKAWDPASADPRYGILPFILSSIYGTAGALVIGVPIGFFTAVYLSKKASPKVKEWMGAAVSLLAAMIVLAIMILPSIIKVSITALDAVPKEYEDASLALGATPEETWFRVSVPAAKSGIATAVVLGVGRAIGEAMAVMMVSGNVANMPSLFESVRFLTTAVSSGMGYADGLYREALFSIALVLFLFIMLINATLNFFLKGERK